MIETATQTIEWPGKSGKTYTYYIYPIGSTFKEEPGNYIYSKETSPNRWSPVYIGETENLNARHARHEKRECAVRHGATHIHAKLTPGGLSVRLAEETDLRNNWATACNLQ